MKNLAAAVRDGIVLLDPVASDLNDVLAQVVTSCSSQGIIPAELQDQVVQTLLDREERGATGIGHGVGVPHAYVDGITETTIVFVRLKRPIDVGGSDHQATRYLFVLLGPTGQVDIHLNTLATIARAVSDNDVRYDLGNAQSSEDVVKALGDFQKRQAPPEPKEEELSDGLKYSGRIAGGFFNDIKRRLPHYASDFTDGLHVKSVTATLFLFFACLAPAVTFGGLMYGVTGGQMGATEMLLATAGCGIVYALISGQPLIILGGTGPLLIFTGILYTMCERNGIDFLPVYAWVGLWTALLMVILALTDASCWISKFTRFTDEIFAGLISLIFIVEAVKSIMGYIRNARSDEIAHDVAFLSIIMALGTFIVAMMLSSFRKSRYLFPAVREFLSDFGPTLAVLLMLGFGMLFPAVTPEPLKVPNEFGPTIERGWLIPFTSAPKWIWFASVGPALLAAVLIYLDQNITARLVNNRDHMLHKGEGYHLDLAVVGVLTGICSVLGLPWLVAATVRSLNHVRALATVEDTITPSGDRRDEIVHTRENRVTGLAVHLLIASTLFFLPQLQFIPNAVLYGLFLYMGIVSISGNQLFERVGLWLMDSNLYPKTHYIRNVPIKVIHIFTAVQVSCLAVLWVVKASVVGILFPLFIALLVPVRMFLGKVLDPAHVDALDAEQLPEEEDAEWV